MIFPDRPVARGWRPGPWRAPQGRPLRWASVVLALAVALVPVSAIADDPRPPEAPGGRPGVPPAEGGDEAATGSTVPTGATADRQRPPPIDSAVRVEIDYQGVTLRQLAQNMAELTGRNFILGEDKDLRETVTIISHKPVTVGEAYEAFLQALRMHGYTTVQIGQNTQIVKSDKAVGEVVPVGQGEDIAWSSRVVTQIIPLENASVSELQPVVKALLSTTANVIAYQPTNSFIVTDSAHNVRRVFQIITQLDVSEPKSRLEIIPIEHADAEEIKSIIEELYGTAEASAPSTAADRRAAARTRRPRRGEPEPETEAVSAGKESKYISKVLSDERTNSLIVLANEQGMTAVKELVEELDVDVDLSSRSQIHVVYLEHAKAEEVAQVLANLSEGGSTPARRPTAAAATTGRPTTAAARAAAAAAAEEPGGSVLAAFDSGMRITHDESTNALVIIASSDDFRIVRSVIAKLDIQRRQVLIDAVILELTSTDELQRGVAYHGPFQPAAEAGGIIGGQFGTSSLGLSQDLLSGLAIGVFGPTVEVPFNTGLGIEAIEVPAFGIVLQALRTNSSVDIVSNPNLLTLDNSEAKIVVGRKVPFPTSTSFSQLGTPIVSYQREDVATTLKVVPRINSSNQVTLEVVVEVAEVEEDNRGLDASQAGFITSTREIETTALVGDNQTVVLGGLVGTTETNVETKVPILGDLPVLGVLFRGSRTEHRKSNLMIFLTPHIVDDDMDLLEIMRVKEAQRQEFIRRFYGKSRDEQMQEIEDLLKYSMNFYGNPSVYAPSPTVDSAAIDGEPLTDETRRAVEEALEESRGTEPGAGAGELPPEDLPEETD